MHEPTTIGASLSPASPTARSRRGSWMKYIRSDEIYKACAVVFLGVRSHLPARIEAGLVFDIIEQFLP